MAAELPLRQLTASAATTPESPKIDKWWATPNKTANSYVIEIADINKLFGTILCISDSIYQQAQADILARPLKRVQVKGRRTEFMIYELLALRPSDDPELKVRDPSRTKYS